MFGSPESALVLGYDAVGNPVTDFEDVAFSFPPTAAQIAAYAESRVAGNDDALLDVLPPNPNVWVPPDLVADLSSGGGDYPPGYGSDFEYPTGPVLPADASDVVQSEYADVLGGGSSGGGSSGSVITSPAGTGGPGLDPGSGGDGTYPDSWYN